MRNQDEYEEQILLEFFSALQVEATEFIHERAGAPGTRPDFKVHLREDGTTIGVELTAMTTEADERVPKVLSSMLEGMKKQIRDAILQDPGMSAQFQGKGLNLELSGIPPKAKLRSQLPGLITWLSTLGKSELAEHRPPDEGLAWVGAVRIEDGPGGPPVIIIRTRFGPTEPPSVLARLLEKRRIALAADFKRFDETWLLMHGPMASICATCFALGPEEIREAATCLAARVFDRIYLFNPTEKTVWRFGWNTVTEL